MKTLKYLAGAVSLVIAFSLASCGGGGEKPGTETTAEVTRPAYDATKIDPTAPVTEVNLETTGASMGDMRYSMNEITVKSGTTVKINFQNNGVGEAMQHNFVLVYKGKMEEVAMEGVKAGIDKDYIATDDPDILVAGKVLKPGESETITFPAPPAGEYEFVCTYPGHWQMMNGKFIVQ